MSWPMHHPEIIDSGDGNGNDILPDRQNIYNTYMEGCREKYPKPVGTCDDSEEGRVDMSLDQPKAMQNYTDLGFKKIRTPPQVWALLEDFWNKNNPTEDIHNSKPENWAKGNSFANHWTSPTYMLSVEDVSLRGAGEKLKDAVWDAARSTLEEWTGEELKACSLYGIRIYTEGAMLATHVDRLPLVSSAIVNVAQDVDEPWPIEVIGHDGRAHNITMEPGDMVLYESHSVLHGRPFALKGRYFANIFIHFEPTGHTLRHTEKMAMDGDKHVNKKYKEAIKKGHGGHENESNILPSYILQGTDAARIWLDQKANGEFDDTYEHEDDDEEPEEYAHRKHTEGATKAHFAVQEGDTVTLLKIISEREELVHAKDSNGWTPLHEAVRTGSVDAVQILVDKGADVNALTKHGISALYLARGEHGEDHPVIDLLTEMGALFEGPEL